MLSGSEEYTSEESLRLWATHLKEVFDVKSTFSLGTDRSKEVGGLEHIQQADVLVVFCRRWELGEEQATVVRQAILSGKPVLAIRTASHGFEFFKEFDSDILGGDYQGHGKGGEEMRVLPCSDHLNHPVLKGIEGWKRAGKVYRNPHLAKDVSLLLWAETEAGASPMAWVRENGKKRVFYTSMGFPEDFLESQFIKLLDNALLWSMGKFDANSSIRDLQKVSDK